MLVIGLDPGFRAALAVALQPRCRVDVAARISEALEMLGSMMPDLAILDLRSASLETVLGLQSLRAKFPEGPLIIVGSVDRIGLFLQSSAGHPEILVREPVDVGVLFDEIATLLPPDPDGVRMKSLSAASSAAVGRVVAQYADHTLRVEHLSAGTGFSAAHHLTRDLDRALEGRGSLQRHDAVMGLDGNTVAPRLRVGRERILHPRRQRARRDHLAADVGRRHLGTAHEPLDDGDHRLVLHLLGVDDQVVERRIREVDLIEIPHPSGFLGVVAAHELGGRPLIRRLARHLGGALDPMLHAVLERRERS